MLILVGHIGEACCGGRKQMTSGAGVSYGRGRNKRKGREIDWCGRNGFS